MKTLLKLFFCAALSSLSLLETAAQKPVTADSLSTYIRNSWDATIRFRPKDSADHIGLPRPYTVPCKAGRFQEMYYWDTFFSNAGLLVDGRLEQAMNNTEDLASMVTRFGKILNGSRMMYIDHSQPPYLCMMVDDVFRHTDNRAWLAKMYPLLKQEYNFWMTRRITPCGLNHYATEISADRPDSGMARYALERTKRTVSLDTLSDAQIARMAFNGRAECESGWDFTPRFDNRCADFCPVDLNANLYFYEVHLAEYSRLLGYTADSKEWKKAAQKRRKLIHRYLYDAKEGMFYDYDYVHQRRSSVKSCAVFSLLLARAVDASVAHRMVKAVLPAIEYDGGLAATEQVDNGGTYQWAYPNGWAPLQYVAIRGLQQYDMKYDAQRIAHKYVDSMVKIFTRTGNIWEKYNVVEGSANVNSEGGYGMPPMMGWTAGVFEYARAFLKQ